VDARAGQEARAPAGRRGAGEMGPPPYQGDWGKKIVTERRYLARFGGEIHASRTGAFGLVVRNLLFSREYTLADRANYFRGILGSMRLLWPELNQVDLFESVPELKVPVFFMEGRSDWESPYEVAERYFEAIKGAVEGADLVRPVGAPAQFRGKGLVQRGHGGEGAPGSLPGIIGAVLTGSKEVVRLDHRPRSSQSAGGRSARAAGQLAAY